MSLSFLERVKLEREHIKCAEPVTIGTILTILGLASLAAGVGGFLWGAGKKLFTKQNDPVYIPGISTTSNRANKPLVSTIRSIGEGLDVNSPNLWIGAGLGALGGGLSALGNREANLPFRVGLGALVGGGAGLLTSARPKYHTLQNLYQTK